MKKKLIAIGIIGMFLLTGLTAVSAVGMEASVSETQGVKKDSLSTSGDYGDIEIIIHKVYGLEGTEYEDDVVGIAGYAKNIGTEPIENVALTARVYKGKYGIGGQLEWLCHEQPSSTLEPGEENEKAIGIYFANIFGDGTKTFRFEFEVYISQLGPAKSSKQSTKVTYSSVKANLDDNYQGTMEFINVVVKENNKQSVHPLLNNVLARFLDNHPHLFPLLRAILGL